MNKNEQKFDNWDFFLSEFAFPFVADTIIAKDAGFVYESLWYESNRTLFVKNGFVSPDLRVIWQSRFKLNPRTQICESRIIVMSLGFIILSICEDLLDS